MDNKYYLPPEMSAVLEACYQGNYIPGNLRLLLHKHAPVRVIEKPTEKQDSAKTKQDNAKTVWLRNIASQYKADPALVRAARYRWLSYVDALNASFISMAIDWRMVIGLGGNSVFESDMTLHPLYGLPIIPGSALKGLTRAWVETEKNETTQVPGPGGKSISLVERIFGNQRDGETQHAGSVIFFDAVLRDENFNLTLDIMNPHYPDYYRDGKPPSNDQKPIPVPFLTVGNRATFLFAIASRNPLNEAHIPQFD
jgi:CRISPR type III-B/RAMP module RAMP protein Cmr6